MIPVLSASEAEGTVGGIQVVLPPIYEIFWAALILLAIIVVVGRFALPKIYENLDERQALIEEGLNAAETAKEDQALAARQRQDIIRAANSEAQGIRDQADADGKRILAKAQQEAHAQANRILDAAQRQVEAERQAAQISLRSDVGMLAAELAEKIVGEHLTDTKLTARVVDRFLDDLERDESPIPSGGKR